MPPGQSTVTDTVAPLQYHNAAANNNHATAAAANDNNHTPPQTADALQLSIVELQANSG